MKNNVYLFFESVLFTIFIISYEITFPNKDSLLSTAMLVVNVIFIIIIEIKRIKNFWSPILFWYIFWLIPISIGRIDLGIYIFGTTWSNELKNIIVINTITFYLFFWFASIGSKEKINIDVKEMKINRMLLNNIIITILVTACFAYILNTIQFGYIPQLSSNVNFLRQSFVTTGFYSIINISRFIFSLVPLGIYFSKGKQKTIIIILSILLGIFEGLTGWRGYLFQIFLFFMIGQLLLVNIKNKNEIKNNNKRIVKYSIIAVLFIAIIAITRTKTYMSITKAIIYTLTILYLYIAPNFLNFQTTVFSFTPKYSMLYTTQAIWSIFISPEKMSGFSEVNNNIGAFNVSTYLLQPYEDLGISGTIIWTAIIAIFSGKIYKNVTKRLNVSDITLLGISVIIIFTMHNGFFLRSSSVIIWIITAVMISKLIKKKKKIIKLNDVIGESSWKKIV